jgi:hypothetical protein
VNDRCPGFPRAALGDGFVARPITEHRLRRRLTIVSTVEEQVARELVTRDDFRSSDDPVPEHTVRVNFHCNQSCEFCFVSTHLPPAAEAAIRAAIDDAGRAGAVLVLAGGEPTLNCTSSSTSSAPNARGARSSCRPTPFGWPIQC